jgi:hypothetical protein
VDDKASFNTVEIEEFYVDQAINHRTPLKMSKRSADKLNYFELTPYKKQIIELTLDSFRGQDDSISVGLNLLRPMDDALFETSTNLLKLIKSYDDTVVDLSSVSVKVDTIQGTIGNQVININEEFQAPTLWGSVAVLAGHINRMNSVIVDVDPRFLKLQRDLNTVSKEAKEVIRSSIEELNVDDITNGLTNRVDVL